MSASRRDLTPVGEILVSYEATEMPTEVIERLSRETLEDVREHEIAPRKAVLVMGWLLRIACQKIRALEEDHA